MIAVSTENSPVFKRAILPTLERDRLTMAGMHFRLFHVDVMVNLRAIPLLLDQVQCLN